MNRNTNKIQINKGNYSLETKERELEFEKKRSYGCEKIYFEYRKLWYDLPKGQIINKYPLLLDLELSTICNLSCPFCYTITEEFKRKVGKKFMSFGLFRKIIDEVAGNIPAIRLSLRGEPTLHPDFIECIKYAKVNGISEVSFLTNGSKLNKEFFEKILLAGADWITISFDGLYDEYEKNRAPLKYNQMYEKLKKILDVKSKYNIPKPVIKIQSVWPAIEKNTTEFYKAMSEISDLVAFNPIIDFNHNIPLSQIEYEENFICPMLYQRLVIGSNGLAMMCSNDENGEFIIGDANKQTIYDIWHSEKINSVRSMHLKENGFKNIAICQKCYLPRKTTEDKFIVDDREIIVKNYK